MSTSRQNAPLVELIAELRWEASAQSTQTGSGGIGPTFIGANSNNALDLFFMRFGAIAHSLSHTDTERLVPSGFPMFSHQPVYRFKHVEAGETRSLYQVGPGLFSANAVPPYESWTKFEPVVEAGVDALLKTRDDNEKTRPFTGISLRYIDAFGPYHTEGRDISRFLNEVLNIAVVIPEALSQHLRADAAIKPMIQLQIPMKDGFLMSVAIGEGVANFQPAIMVDTTVATTLPVPADLEAVMTAYKTAHDAIAASFTKLVKPIDHLMPIKREELK